LRLTSDSPARRPDLGAIVYEVAVNAPEAGFIGDMVMPPFPVSEQTATYPVIPREALFNVYDARRGSDGRYNSYDGEFERGYYATEDYGLERRKDDRDMAIYQSEFNYESVIATTLMRDIIRSKEYRIAALVMAPGTFPPVNAAIAWSAYATSTPVKDIDDAREVLRLRGIPANCVILPAPLVKALKNSEDIKARVYQLFPDIAKSGMITNEQLRTVFDVQHLLIGGALKNTAGTGLGASLLDIWGSRYVQVCRIAEGPDSDVLEPCIGRQFMWNDGAGGEEIIVEEYRDEARRSDMLRVRHDSVEKMLVSYDDSGSVKSAISASAGVLIDSTAATT
jgi:hypothetical protein